MRRSPRPRAGAASLALGAAGLLLLAGVAVPPAAPVAPVASPSTAAVPTVGDPLRVVLHRLQPAVLPEDRRAEVTVAGTVRNTSEEVWSDLNAYLLSSPGPITSAVELAAAVASDADTEIGDRIVEPGLFDDLPDLDPGEAARFRLSVPRRALELSGEPGVYWLGVHVLGTSADAGRDVVADGRARTFLPLVPEDTEGTELAVAAQVRARVVRDSDGRLAFPDPLARRLDREGRLHRLLALSRTAPGQALSWVVDPAVVEAVGSLADGNPAYDAEPVTLPRLAPAGPGSEAQPGGTGAARPGSGLAARRAVRWLTGFVEEAPRHEVLAVPYGDLDVAAAYSSAHAALTTYALDVSDRVLDGLGVDARPVVVPPPGFLPANALTALPPEVLAVLAPAAVPELPRPLVATATGTTALVAGTPETTRGPGPGAPRAALAVRQRLLADAALHALGADRGQPVVALLPAWWDPGPRWQAAHFFDGLTQPWLDLVDVAEVERDARPSTLRVPDGVVYPEDQATAELGEYVLQDTADLVTRGATYESVLIDAESVGDRLGRQALLTSSFWNRTRPRLAADRARGTSALVDSLLDGVVVRSPPFVTLSSEDGEFLVTLANQLQERVRVGLRASVSGSGLQLTTPEVVTLEPNERRSVRIGVRSSGIGIHRVELQPTTASGLPVGSAAALSVRSSSVGLVLWFIIAGGSVVLFGAIAVRVVRRVRRRSATHGPVLVDQDGRAAGQPESAA
ncbi:MAG: hypothetical protein AVDCRST_MAG36-1627 [uncultured Nocardioidaceae bacterium]|uniref:Uncharacterized protein n=1 Tax=uncultured Nocardioidaceae bacterium TaxID=253824 RepID=A0A6J4LZ34_9ACTN|nr:MAG: hypothetical protein AVDCRST_MAG36-1627 [uncultured Nocardioidaceae bacterium]